MLVSKNMFIKCVVIYEFSAEKGLSVEILDQLIASLYTMCKNKYLLCIILVIVLIL